MRITEKCGSCSHEYDSAFRARLAELFRLDQRLSELVEIANRTSASVKALKDDIASIEAHARKEAQELAEMSSAFSTSSEIAQYQAYVPQAPETQVSETPASAIPVSETPVSETPVFETPEPVAAASLDADLLKVKPLDEIASIYKADKAEPVSSSAKQNESGNIIDKLGDIYKKAGGDKKQKKSDVSLETALGQKWLPIIGVVTVIFGVGYFLKYAIDQGWVSPMQRVLAAYAWGAAFISAGHVLRKRGYPAYGLIIMGGGLAAWYFSTFAAYQLYGLIGQYPAFALMFLITLAAGGLSVIYSNMWLSVLGLFGGYFTPIMLSTGGNDYAFLFIYLAILGCGVLGVAYYRRWPTLHYLGFIGTYTLFYMWYAKHFGKSPLAPALMAQSAYFLGFSFVPFAYRFFRADEPEDCRTARADVSLIIVNSFISFGLVYNMISTRLSVQHASIAAFAYCAAFAAMAFLTMTRLAVRPKAFSVFSANAGLFMGVGIVLLFSKHWITFFWAVQAAGLFWAAMRTREKGLLRAGALALIALACFKALMYDYFVLGLDLTPWHFSDGFTHMIASRLIVVIGIFGALHTMIWCVQYYGEYAGDERPRLDAYDGRAYLLLTSAFTALLLIALTAEVSGFFYDYLPKSRHAAITILWMSYAAWLMRSGVRDTHEDKLQTTRRQGAIALFVASMMKVALVDYALMGFEIDGYYFTGGYLATLATRLVLAAMVLGSLRCMIAAHRQSPHAESEASYASIMEWAFGVYVFTALNVEISALFHDYMPGSRPAAITIYWAAYASRLMLRGTRGVRPRFESALRSLAMILIIAAAFKSFADLESMGMRASLYFSDGYWKHFVPRVLMEAAILISASFMASSIGRMSREEAVDGVDLMMPMALGWGFGLYLFWTLNLEVSGFFHDFLPKARFASISVLWTAFSAALMVLGFRRSAPMLRKLSFGLFSATLIKVFFLDISKIDTPYRILSFIVLGTVLVCVSYLYHRFHDRLAEVFANTEAQDEATD